MPERRKAVRSTGVLGRADDLGDLILDVRFGQSASGGHQGVIGRSKGVRIGGRVLHQQPMPDSNTGRNPADRSPNPDGSKVPIGVLHVVQGQGIGQGQGRRIDDAVDQGQPQEARIALHPRQVPNQSSAQQMADGQELLGGHPPVGHLAGDERTHDGSGCAGWPAPSPPGPTQSRGGAIGTDKESAAKPPRSRTGGTSSPTVSGAGS